MDEPADDAEVQARLARERLAVLNAIVAGQERHAEVAATLWAAEDRRTAIVAVAELLGVEQAAAQAVVERPWWCLGAGSRRQAEEDRDEIARWVSDVGGSGAG